MREDEHGATLPSGTVTFLMTDIEGSTRRWEESPDAMRRALPIHDRTLDDAIERHRGHRFKHTGDGVCAAFESAADALLAAIDAQRVLELPVRMGIATGEATARENDYFAPIVNRTARLMAAGHGGQILASAATIEDAALDVGVTAGFANEDLEIRDLGSRLLRDLSEPMQIYQVRTPWMPEQHPPLNTADKVVGNLPKPITTFLGRETEVDRLVELVGRQRLVTLVGVGGVGKTRLSMRVGRELAPSYPGGVWFVELAALTDASALPDLVATTLGVTPQTGMSVTKSVCRAVAGRDLLLVLDNCEHVLDEAAALVAALLQQTSASVLATSREALRIDGEQAWPVLPFDSEDARSTGVALFVERARAVRPDFSVDDGEVLASVVEVCRRLDGIALAIELAAARMMSMTVDELGDRLGDRFQLLGSGRRAVGRHQTLRRTVEWSYDLLDDDEKELLVVCSVFTGGFTLQAAAFLRGVDELSVLELLDSLVGKSLVTTAQSAGRTRYGMLETIREFGQDRLDEFGGSGICDRHAEYFAAETLRYWEVWDGVRQREALDWADVELANLRTAFRRSIDAGSTDEAAVIAAHLPIVLWPLQRFEPVGWAEELLPVAVETENRFLPRLYVSAALCLYDGRPDLGVELARSAASIESDPAYEPFVDGWSGLLEALSHLFAGRIERRVEICTELAGRSEFARVIGLCGLTWALPAVGRFEEAVQRATETLDTAREFGNPFWIGWALGGAGRAYSHIDPERALEMLREGLSYAEDNRLPFWEANLAQDAAPLEAMHGDPSRAFPLFATAIDLFHRAGNAVFLAATLASLAVFYGRRGDLSIAAVVYGSSTRYASINLVPDLADTVSMLRSELGADEFERLCGEGAAMSEAEAVRSAHQQLRRTALRAA